MKKSALFILLAVLSLLLAVVKGVHILHRHAGIPVTENADRTGYTHRLPCRRPVRPAETPTAALDGKEIEQAIRRRLDADAAINNAVNYLPETADLENRIENRRIVRLYTEMNPADAARIIETIDTRQAVRLLQMMSTESAAAVLSRMKLDKARAVTEQMLQDTIK